MRLLKMSSSRRLKEVIFAIESSCDDTCLSIIGTNTITAIHDFKHSQKKLHQPFGGVVPQLAAYGHRNSFQKILDNNMICRYLDLKRVKFISVTSGPGIGSCLAAGFDVARQLSRSRNIPLVPVNHLVTYYKHLNVLFFKLGHLVSVDYKQKLSYPRLSLIVSGGNTQLVYSRSVLIHHILGISIDEAVGEALDKSARLLNCEWSDAGGLGRELEKLASVGSPAKLNISVLDNYRDPLSFSFSGLKTALKSFISDESRQSFSKEDLAATIQETLFGHVVDRVANCFKIIQKSKLNLKTFSLIGGVASNNYLRDRLEALCQEYDVRLVAPETSLCTDNSIMIGLAGNMIYSAYENQTIPKPTRIDPNWNLEEISVNKHILN